MPPFRMKFVKAKRSRKRGPRGTGIIVVESILSETPSIESSSPCNILEPQLNESSLVPTQPMLQNWYTPEGGSIPSNNTVNDTLALPNEPTFLTATSSSHTGESQSTEINLASTQPQSVETNLASAQTLAPLVSDSTNKNAKTPPELPEPASRKPFNVITNLIPYFNGKPSMVNHFVSQCRLADFLVRAGDKNYLMAIIRNRMEPRVCSAIIGSKQPETVEEVINLVKSAYTRSFNIEDAQDELKTLRRNKHETVDEFGIRVQYTLERGVQAARDKYDLQRFEGIRLLLIENAIRGFLRGLQNDVIAGVISKDDVQDLTTVIRLASKIEAQMKPA